MRPTCLIKELQLILFKMNQFGSKIAKNRASTVWIPENRRIPAGASQANASLLTDKLLAPQTLLLQYLVALAAKYSKRQKYGF